MTFFKERQNICLLGFSMRPNKTMHEKDFVKGTRFKDTSAKSNVLPIHSSQIARANDFLQPKVQDSPKLLLFHIIFFERFFRIKIK
jgi:hypothetical protein